jgi:hypothetical protein
MTTKLDSDRLYRHLARRVDWRRDRESGADVTKTERRTHLYALVAARLWAAESGVVFKWVRSDKFYRDERLWRCLAILDGSPIGCIDECYFEPGYPPGVGDGAELWCECELAVAMLGEFATVAEGAIDVYVNHCTRPARPTDDADVN